MVKTRQASSRVRPKDFLYVGFSPSSYFSAIDPTRRLFDERLPLGLTAPIFVTRFDGNLNFVRKPLLLTLLLCACSAPPTAKVPRKPAGPAEFQAKLVDGGKRYPIEVSTEKGQFRLERDGKLYLGDLDTKSGKLLVIDPKSKTFFRADAQRYSQLFDTHDRPSATRYEGAANALLLTDLRESVHAPFKSPCETFSDTYGGHQKCVSQNTSGGLVSWTHTNKRVTSPQDGMRKVESTARYLDNPELGVLVGGPANARFFEQLQVKKLTEDRFTLPEGFREVLSDEQLRDPRFGYLAPSDLFPETQWTEFMDFARDIPAPPQAPLWTYQKEHWQERGDGPSREMVWIERLYSHQPFDPKKVVLADVDHAFANVKTWDKQAEAGSLSFREGPLSLVFTAHDQVFRIKVLKESMADQIPRIAKALEVRAKRDQALGKKRP